MEESQKIQFVEMAYARVSTKGQSLERQEESIIETIPDLKAQYFFEDKYTGKEFDRPEYMKLKEKIMELKEANPNTDIECNNAVKYLKTKLARFLISCGRSSIAANRASYKFVPLQDFTSNSNIDWSQSIAEIDKQLYEKYNLTPEEIDYIESTIKPME